MKKLIAFFKGIAALGFVAIWLLWNLLWIRFWQLLKIAPLVSGEVVNDGIFKGNFIVLEKDKIPESWSLSKGQLEKLSAWLKLHQSGWDMILASPPPPSYSVLLSHSDGSNSQINLFSLNESWSHAVHISVFKSGKCVFGGSLHLSSGEIASLKSLLSEER